MTIASTTQQNDMEELNSLLDAYQTVEVKPDHKVPAFDPIGLMLDSNVINFIMVLFLVLWLIKKANIHGLIEKKRNEIVELISRAEQIKKTERDKLNETRIKVCNADKEVAKILEEGDQVAESLSDNILTYSNKQAEEMQKKAEIAVENQKQVILDSVATKITDAAFYVAEEHIKQSMNERLHKKYIDEFIDNIDKIYK